MNDECENLDAFLDGELSRAKSDRYEGHLHVCKSCREALNQQRWIDGLLGSPERLELEPVSAALSRSVRNTFSRRWKTQLAACGLAAAAVLVVAVGWTAVLNRQARIPISNQVIENVAREDEPSPNPSLRGRGMAEAPRATFVAGPESLAVPVASRHPNVTIVRVYPTYKSSLTSPATGDESDTDYFNGG
jgi:anti-sigma factor RsiW